MIKRFLEYIRITPYTLIVILVIMILLDGVVRYYWADLYREPGRVRLVNEELASLETMRSEFHAAKGCKILFLGDSAAYGSAVRDSAQTVPAYLEQELNRLWPGKDVKVFNFSFKGYGMSENYFILNSLADEHPDLVVYNVSVGWFSREKQFEHPNVLRLSDTYFDSRLLAETGVKTERSKRDKLTDKINSTVGKAWFFYQNRSAITTLLLGESLRTKTDEWLLALENPSQLAKKRQEENELYLPWYKKDWSVKLGKAGYKVGHLNLSSRNPQVIFYNMMLDMLSRKKVKAVFYTSPQNFTLLERYNMLDKAAWSSGIDNLHTITVSKGVYFADYSSLVNSRYFSDTVHLLAPGNKIVAGQLAHEINRQLGGNRK